MTHQRQEGRKHAVECLQSVAGQSVMWFDARGPIATVVENLEAAAKRFPAEYAEGVLDVCRELKQ